MPETLLAAAPYLAAASATAGVASTVISHQDQVKGQKQAAQAADLRARADAIAQQREKAKQIREARVASASINSATNASGVNGSSVQAGGIGGVQSQSAGNVNFLDVTSQLTTASNTALTSANNYYGASNTFAGIADKGFSLAGSAFNYAFPKGGTNGGRDTTSNDTN